MEFFQQYQKTLIVQLAKNTKIYREKTAFYMKIYNNNPIKNAIRVIDAAVNELAGRILRSIVNLG